MRFSCFVHGTPYCHLISSFKEMLTPWRYVQRFPGITSYPMAPSGKVTLLGDAAHARPPDKGLGGNDALEDARLLTSLLISSKNPLFWHKIIGEYEREMFSRAKLAVQESENAAEYFRQIRLKI